MPGPAPRPTYPRNTGGLRAQNFLRKIIRNKRNPPAITFRLLAESGSRIRTESDAPIRLEQE
jgi:hypothetical protein